MFKKLLALMLALVMTVSLLPTAAFAADGVAEPSADESTLGGSPSSDDAQPSEDAATGEDPDDAENTTDGSPAPDETQPSEDPNGAEDNTLDAPLRIPGRLDGEESDGSESEPAPIAIDPGDKNADAVKKYFVSNNFVGTYVTGRDEADYSNARWSIVIKDDGDVALWYNGEDTNATATFNNVTSGKPGAIVFHHDGWYSDETTTTDAILTVTLNSNGYFTMPKDYHIYWDKDGDGEREDYSFTDAAHYYNETILKKYFADFQGDYTLPDGSGWKITVGEDGGLTLTGDGAKNAFVDYMTMNNDHVTVKAVVFASPDWCTSKGVAYQTLQLNWTAQSSSKDYNFFKASKEYTFYDSTGKTVLKGFSKYSYFMPAEGMYSFGYFAEKEGDSYKYAGTYALSEAYHVAYGDVIGNWSIEIKEDGHVYLHTGEGDENTREAVATAGSTGPNRVTKMYVCVPNRYTNKACTIPAWIELTWVNNSTAKDADLYFTSEAITPAYKKEGGKVVTTFIPPMHFESSKRAEFAQGKLQAYANTYIVNDDTKETITINSDGAVVLHIGENDYTPLYYNLDKTWLTKPADATVTSVVFSAPNWFGAAKQKSVETDRQTVEMSWSAAEEQFTVTTAVTCYKPESEEVSRAYSATTAYYLEKYIDEAQKYMTQYVKGTYTLNDGSGWKIRVDNDGNFFVTFGGEEYEVTNPAPVFVFDKDYTDPESSKGEYGNKGRYLSTVTVPVNGWFADEACTQEAIVKLTWNGKVKNPMDDHQFNLNDPIAIYRKNDDGTVECKYLTGTFYSDEDRELGEEFLKSLDIAGTYQPTEAEGKWWIVIDENGKVTVHATDSQGEEHTFTDVAMDLTMDKKEGKLTFGTITAVTDIKVVVPEWRTVGTNDTLANIMQCAETTFTFTQDKTYVASSYFTPSKTYIYADTDKNGNSWEVKAKKTETGYNKDLVTKNYDNDRAYSDANKEKAKEYFANHAGTYYIDDPDLDYMITVTEEGDIYWGDLTSVTEPLPADVAFDAIHDANGDGKVNEGENTPVPGTISVWLNGYTTGKVSTSSTKDTYTDGTQRADFTWNDTAEENGTPDTAHVFKSSKSAKGFKVGTTTQTNFATDKSYAPAEKGGGESEGEPFTKDGTYETTDGKYKIVVATDSSGKTTYTFSRPEPPYDYPLKLFGSGEKAYLRGKIGMYKKNDVYIVVTKIPNEGYENFLFTAYEVTYNDLNGKQETSSNAPTVTLPAMTRFTDYKDVETGEGPFIVAHEGESMADGTRYSRLSLALHNVQDGDTIYLEEDIKIAFEAMLPDDVGKITIDGQGHTITRDTYIDPNAALKTISDETLTKILADPRVDPAIVPMALEEAEGGDAPAKQHYTGAILQVGAGDEVTLKNVTIDGEGNWTWDTAKLEYDKQLNMDYDIDILDTTRYPQGGHPIKELPGNVTSTESLIKVAGGTLILDGVTLENFYAGDGYEDDRHFIDFMSTHDGELIVKSETVFKHNASRSGVCIGNTDQDKIYLNGRYDEYEAGGHPDKEALRSDYTIMQDNYCFGGNGGLVVAMEGTQVYMEDGTKIIGNVAADTNGTFIQLHKKTDRDKDGDNKGDVYSKLYMNGGEINNNVGLRGGSYGWGQVVYLYNGGAFEMNGGEIGHNIGAGISSIYQQPSADALMLNKGWIHDNTCSLTDEGTDWALDIALMNKGTIGPEMKVEQNYVVGAAAILGGYASGDEYLTNDGEIHGNISVYSYFNNQGNTSTVVNNNLIEGDIRLENGSLVKNGEKGTIKGNITVRGALTESAGESSFHNEGRITGTVELAENAHLYNSGEIEGHVTVKSGGVLELNCNEEGHSHGGVIRGDVTVYPGGVLRTDGNIETAVIEGTIYLEYEDEDDLERMLEVLNSSGITYNDLIPKKHEHTVSVNEDGDVIGKYDETTIEPDDEYKCTDPWSVQYACQTCGKVVVTKEIPAKGEHEFYLYKTVEATCTEGKVEYYRCSNCSAYNNSTSPGPQVKLQVSPPLGHKYVELERLYIPPTTYASGHIYYICTECGKLWDHEIDSVHEGNTKHTFQNEDGSLNEADGEITIAPTCTADGEMTFKCKTPGCTAEITVTIPAKGHSYPNPLTADPKTDYTLIDHKDSTCTNAGYDKYAPVCTVCKEVDTSYTYQVNLQKLGHEWSEWEDVNKDAWYSCTAEREQERHCIRKDSEGNSSCDDLDDTGTETRLGGMTNHIWGDDNVTCNICGYVSTGHHIDYMTNGGTAPQSLTDDSKKARKAGNKETLWQPSADETLKDSGWTRETAAGQAVFVGWSEEDHGATPFETKPADVKFISFVVIPEDKNAFVYAVWAMDRNKNGKPDYDESPVSIEYDANGGDGTVPEALTGVLPGGSYPLETAPGLTKGGNVFAGWSLEPCETVIKAHIDPNDPNDATAVDIVKSLAASPYTVPAETEEDITLYAVYAVDGDGDGKPDFWGSSKHVEYYINGGQVHEGYTVDGEGMFYVCNDYHAPGSQATLLAVEAGGMMIYRGGAVLIGWSAKEHTDLVETEEEADGLLIEKVTIPEGATDNEKVYAVWAEDVNDNCIADYTESKLTHTYFDNRYLSQGSGSTLPVGMHLDVTIPVPDRVPDILPGTGIELASNDYFGSADLLDAEGNKVSIDDKLLSQNVHYAHYVQVGWSQYSHGVCESELDYNNWVIGANENAAARNAGEDDKYQRIIYDSRFENAYAVWAPDENENGTADFLEGKETSGGDSGSGDSGSGSGGSGSGSGSGSTVCDGGVNCPSRDYVDVDQSLWYHESVDYVIANKLMNGRGELIFAPNGVTTRAEAVVILYRLDGAPAVTAVIPFEDVPDGRWYSDAVCWAAANGIVFGYGNGRFGPDDAVTREQMAAILYRYAGYKGYDVTKLSDLAGYTDAGAVSGWALPAVKWAVGEGVVEGTDAATLSPSGDSTRAQVATIFMHFRRKFVL